jgi:hypothetical protein
MNTRTVIYKNQCYLINTNFDVFFLRDNFKTEAMVEILLGGAMQISVADITGKQLYKFENNQWYFWEHDFMCWEAANSYHECPELAPEIQAQYMRGLNT